MYDEFSKSQAQITELELALSNTHERYEKQIKDLENSRDLLVAQKLVDNSRDLLVAQKVADKSHTFDCAKRTRKSSMHHLARKHAPGVVRNGWSRATDRARSPQVEVIKQM